MIMRLSKWPFIMAVVFFSSSCHVFKNSNRKNTSTSNPTSSLVKSDTTKRALDSSNISKLKPYKEIITAKAVSDSGLFIVHKIDQRYFFEITIDLLQKDILVVSRIAKAAAGTRGKFAGFPGLAGDQIGNTVIQFVRGPNNKLFVKMMSFTEKSTDSSENGLYRSVQNSNLNPIMTSFDIKTLSADSSALVIDMTDFLNSDNSLFYFSPMVKKNFELGGIQKDKSYILGIQSFPINTELQSVLTYAKGDETATYEVNSSIVLLPKDPMKPRYTDERVGYFSRSFINYDSPKGVELTSMITRWRLEPKEEDKEKYLRGELVEPEKPIIYYIDPTTPKKWIPYLIQGVNDWQKAFERAGFKNAIYALEAPTNDPEFNIYDARHNAIMYQSTHIQNAVGPHVHDPRTGEILETHVKWYHNIAQLLQNWYMIQAGPNDPCARKMVFNDALMGQLIRFVASHEVGHTLGLAHNFGASSTVPVDSLRSKSYLDKNGFCPSIMDYARFNYVAQPEDGLTQKQLLPRIGVYDEWAIEWGYRWLPQLKTREEEKVYMNKWIIGQLAKDKRYWFGEQPNFFVNDPRKQAEDLGDDAMRASFYGIENLKRVMKHLKEWTIEPNENFESLKQMKDAVVNQYQRYIFHVANNIGLYTWTPRRAGEQGSVVGFTPKATQKKAVEFLCEQLFQTPTWIMDKDIFSLIGGQGGFQPLILQHRVIDWIVNNDTYTRLFFYETERPKEAYRYTEFLSDIEKGIWKELKGRMPIDVYRRNLQKTYAEQLITKSSTNPISAFNVDWNLKTDFFPILRSHMNRIIRQIDEALPFYKDEISKQHLVNVKARLKKALNPDPVPASIKPANTDAVNGAELLFRCGRENQLENLIRYQGCWDEKIFIQEYKQ